MQYYYSYFFRCYQQLHDNDRCIGRCCWCRCVFITAVTIDPEDTTCCSQCRLNRSPTRSEQSMRTAVLHIAPIENAGRSGARDLYIYVYISRRVTPFGAMHRRHLCRRRRSRTFHTNKPIVAAIRYNEYYIMYYNRCAVSGYLHYTTNCRSACSAPRDLTKRVRRFRIDARVEKNKK